jgi:copper chaperone CopZ
LDEEHCLHKGMGSEVKLEFFHGVVDPTSVEALVSWISPKLMSLSLPSLAHLPPLLDHLEVSGLDVREYHPEVLISVEGMMCQKNCGTTVTNTLLSIPGVVSAHASFEKRSALIRGSAPLEVLLETIESIGFEAKPSLDPMELEFYLGGASSELEVIFARFSQASMVWTFPNVARIVLADSQAREDLMNELELAGFDVREYLPETLLHVEGMMCQKNCGTVGLFRSRTDKYLPSPLDGPQRPSFRPRGGHRHRLV